MAEKRASRQAGRQAGSEPFSSPDTPSRNNCRFDSSWLHLDAFLTRSGSSQFRTQTHHNRAQIRLPEAIADLLQFGFVWTPSCQDLDQAIFEPRYSCPKPRLICFNLASFGHLSVKIWIQPFSNPDGHSQSYHRFASIWLHLDRVHHQDDEREVHEPALPSIVPRGPSTNQPSASRRNGSLVVLNGASHVLV